MQTKLVYLLLLLVPVWTLAAEETPVEVIRTATRHVLNELRFEPALRKDPEQLRMLIERHVAPHMDFVTLSRLTLGKNWRRATAAQRERFVREYGRLLVRVYAAALAGYSRQKIEYLSSKVSDDQRRATVRTRIVEPGQAPLEVDYSLRKIDGNWKIYDVRIEGISLVMNYRASFSEEISAHGFDGLIERLVARNTSRQG